MFLCSKFACFLQTKDLYKITKTASLQYQLPGIEDCSPVLSVVLAVVSVVAGLVVTAALVWCGAANNIRITQCMLTT